VPPAHTATAHSPHTSLTSDVDRRQVTVLFADVSGFTTISERLDPEDVRAFQNALFQRLAEAVARYDGFVEKFVGDAVMAVFGAPIAHEDDPARALRAALDMVEASNGLSEQWAARLGQPVKLHIGVHTGPVVAGNLGESTGAAYAVTGDTVNTAARLLAAASGTILVSAATHALAGHLFTFGPAHQLSLRGKAEPVVAHRLVGLLADPLAARGLSAHGLGSPMIGRADELDQLLSAFHRMQRGRAQLVSVVGEAGTGKSRLIAEFLSRLESGGELARTAIRRSACSSLGEPTYGAFSALFREAYHVDAADSLEIAHEKLATGLEALGARSQVAEAIVPVLSYILGVDELRQRDFEPEQLKRQIILAARTLVDRRLQEVSLLFVVEDVHWADSASVELLRDVVDHFADRALMVVLSHRSETPPPLVVRAAQSIVRLAPLTSDETRAVVSALFGHAVGDSVHKLQEFVSSRAGGNPLFVEEIVRALLGKGYLSRRGDFWECTATCDDLEVPPTLTGLLLSRVDRLPRGARRLLQEAAVLGAEFEESLLHRVATDAPPEIALLDGLVEADLVRQVGHGREGTRYKFTHALVHEVVYQNMLISHRTQLHERAGRALEAIVGPHPNRLSDLEALGHHWSLSSYKARGAGYLAAAGDWARAIYANEDAIRHYERALAALRGGEDCNAQVQSVRERLADVLALTGRRADALAHFEAIRAELELVPDRASTARLYRKIGALHWELGDRDCANACFASGLDQLGNDGDPLERAQLFQELGRLAFRAGDNGGAISWAERALAEASCEQQAGRSPERAREASSALVQAYNTLGVAFARTDRLPDAVTQIEQSIALAEEHGLLQAACRGYTNLGVLYSSLDPPRAIDTCLRGLETARKIGDLAFQSRLYANLAVAYCALTDRCEAEGMEAAKQAADLDRRLGLVDHLAVPLVIMGQIHQCHGDHAMALASYNEALTLAQQVGDPQLLFPCYDGLATLNLDAGNLRLAESYLAKAKQVCERSGLEPDALMVLPFFC
jgi:adenylate cyclase